MRCPGKERGTAICLLPARVVWVRLVGIAGDLCARACETKAILNCEERHTRGSARRLRVVALDRQPRFECKDQSNDLVGASPRVV